MRLTKIVTDLVFPQRLYCNCCGKYIDKTRTYGLCDHCIKRMSFKINNLMDEENQKYFNAAVSAMGYGVYERQLIFGLKYNGRTYLAREIAEILRDALLTELSDKKACPWLYDDYIVPVPVHKEKLKTRGFNQAEKIGRHISAGIGIPLCSQGLVRTVETTNQRALSAEEREQNINDAFIVNPEAVDLIKGKRILLLDDIYTTGATARNCAKVLLDAGAERIDFLALCSAKNKQHEINTCKEETL